MTEATWPGSGVTRGVPDTADHSCRLVSSWEVASVAVSGDHITKGVRFWIGSNRWWGAIFFWSSYLLCADNQSLRASGKTISEA